MNFIVIADRHIWFLKNNRKDDVSPAVADVIACPEVCSISERTTTQFRCIAEIPTTGRHNGRQFVDRL